MKKILLLALVIATFAGCSRSPASENENAELGNGELESSDSMVYVQAKAQLTQQLDSLRDSIVYTIDKLDLQKDNPATRDTTKVQNALAQLTRDKDLVERNIQEVDLTAWKSWDNDYVDRIHRSMENVRHELKTFNKEHAIYSKTQ